MIGFVLGVGLGVVLGAVIGVSKTAYDTAYPLLVGFSSIPKVAVVPIFVLWFGSGSVPAVLTALSICFFPIVVNIATGLATTEPELEDVLKALGASKLDILWNVGLPRTMPFFFASLKVAVSYAFVGAVLSETVASNRGIGNVMMTASSNFNVPLVFAGPVRSRRPRRRALRHLLGDRGTRHRLGHPQERPARDMKHVSANRHPTLIEETTMLARVSAALLGVALFAGTACAQETDDQVHARLEDARLRRRVLLCQGQRLLQRRGLNVVIDQGEGSGATVTRIMSGAYDAGFGDVNAIIQNASTKPQDAPGHGLHDLEPAAVRHRHQEDQRHQHHQGFRGPHARRRAGHADHAAAAGVRQQEQAGGREDQDLQHGAEPAGADADQGRHRRRAGVQHHELLQPRAEPPGSRQGLQMVLVRRLRHGPLFQRRDGLEEAAGRPIRRPSPVSSAPSTRA
jgi:ABC-type proline/glycine betaine transport system permease subunit